MTTPLFPYQVDGARFLSERKRALLADDMGLGKSAQAIAAATAVDAGKVLVVCPASVVENWRREIERFAPGRISRWRVESYDRARSNLAFLLSIGYDAIILDEAHYLKSRTAKRTKAIFGEKCDGVGGLVERAEHVFLLTGTPTPNNPAELWPMLRAVMPLAISKNISPGPEKSIVGYKADDLIDPSSGEFYRPLSYHAFMMRYCKTRNNGFGLQITGGRNLAELRERIAPFILRRKKDEVLKDLPPIRFDALPLEGRIEMTPEMEDSAAAVAKALRDEGVAGLAKLAPHVATLRRLTGLAKVSPALEWIKDWLDSGGKKLVVFAHHREVIENLAAGLSGHRVPWVKLDGGMTGEQRTAAVDDFQRDPHRQVFIGQTQAAGTGITLTAASDVLFVEYGWVPAENQQAAMRVHRISQRNACLVRYAVLAGSIDEAIGKAVARKSEDIAKLFG